MGEAPPGGLGAYGSHARTLHGKKAVLHGHVSRCDTQRRAAGRGKKDTVEAAQANLEKARKEVR